MARARQCGTLGHGDASCAQRLVRLADIALYSYTRCADEGGFEVSRYKALSAWLNRVAAQPNHAPLNESW